MKLGFWISATLEHLKDKVFIGSLSMSTIFKITEGDTGSVKYH